MAAVRKEGLGWVVTGFFLIANMAGAGFLSLPMAMLNTGWLGPFLMTLFCVMVGYSGTRLGICWVMLEERWPEDFSGNERQPYRDIGERSLGKWGGRIAIASVLITLTGATTVLLALTGTFTVYLSDTLSSCEYTIIFGLLMIPFTWFGTPKDFWQASVVAVAATVVACVVVVVELYTNTFDTGLVEYPNPSISSFSLGFGAVLFSFGGASMFPTVQNDMRDRTQFWKSVVLAFVVLLSLYLPVAMCGYTTFGSTVSSNILTNVGNNIVITIAVCFEIVNIVMTYVVAFNPIGQGLEDIIGVPREFGIKRILVRSSIVLVEILIVMTVPKFGMILQLVGGSTVTLASFILPPLMYIKLIDNCPDPTWPKRTIPLWERVLLWELIALGTIGGICSSVSGLMAIITDGLGDSCFVKFT